MLTDNTMKNDIKQAASRRNIAAAMLAAILCVASTGCRKQSLESTYSSQEDRIDSYITSQMESNEDYELVHNNGSNRIIIQAGSGNALAPGGTVSFYYAGYMFSGSISASNMFATNWQAVAEESGWSLTDSLFRKIRIREQAGRHESCKFGACLSYKGGKRFRINEYLLYLQVEELVK